MGLISVLLWGRNVWWGKSVCLWRWMWRWEHEKSYEEMVMGVKLIQSVEDDDDEEEEIDLDENIS